MKQLSNARLLEWGVHILFVITAAIFAYTMFFGAPATYAELDVGDVLPDMQRYINSEQDAMLLLALAPSCPYCKLSYPFYKELIIMRNQGQHSVQVVAAVDTSGSVRLQKMILEEAGVFVDSVVTLPFHLLKIYGVPTIVLLSDMAVVQAVWQGFLEDESAALVLDDLGFSGKP